MADLVPPSATLVAGKYRLIREIGRGGMGTVWEAQHASLGTVVAIKFIDASYAESMEARTRFDNEARAAASLQSKHAIQIFDHGVTEDGRPYIVMELLLGEALDKRLDRVGRMSLHETAKILLQVCRGLGRAHERGITHRDLKPENIFLVRSEDDDHDDERAKILDFGIAKMRSAEGISGLTSGTKTGAVLGTPYFMSPEQARGLKEIDHRTDLWSLGIIAYKCVVGVLPFEGQAIGDLLVKICTSPPPIPSRHNPDLPPAFDAWFARTMEREPERRFQSAAELADGLAFAAGMATRGRPSFDGGRPVSSLGSPAYAPQISTAFPMSSVSPMRPAYGSAPEMAPHLVTPGDYRAALTPPPGAGFGGVAPHNLPAVTSAPFTTSMYPSGIPRSRHVLAWSIAAVLGLGAFAGVMAFLFIHRDDDTRTARVQDSTSSTSSAPGASSASAIAPAAPPAVAAGGAASPATRTPSSDPATASGADAGLLQLATPKNGARASANTEPAGANAAPAARPGHGGMQQSPWVSAAPVPAPAAAPAQRPALAPQPAPNPNQGHITDQSGF